MLNVIMTWFILDIVALMIVLYDDWQWYGRTPNARLLGAHSTGIEPPEKRYNYEYSEEELKEWVPVIAKLATEVKDTSVYFNNHYNAKAATNATTLQKFLHTASIPRTKSHRFPVLPPR